MITTVLNRGEMVKFRGNLLPLFRLGEVFGVPGALTDPTEALILVVDEGGRRVGLMVDAILGQQQTVIKSLGEAMGQLPGIAGATILADGRPGLILDAGGLIKLAMDTGRYVTTDDAARTAGSDQKEERQA